MSVVATPTIQLDSSAVRERVLGEIRGLLQELGSQGALVLRNTLPYMPVGVHLDLDYPDAREGLNRWLPLVKWLLAIPHYIVLLFLGIAQKDEEERVIDHQHVRRQVERLRIFASKSAKR